ncbi:hypothetical protein B7494_g1954 [Chlorociboria aeruginascens]|nr:hypothetical protein B7494_g1954 [Chlorociboria aeruginascens]
MLIKCPLALSNDNFPQCAFPAERAIPINEYCHGCNRITWNWEVLKEEEEHRQRHLKGQCDCTIIFDGEIRDRKEFKPPTEPKERHLRPRPSKGKGRDRDFGLGEYAGFGGGRHNGSAVGQRSSGVGGKGPGSLKSAASSFHQWQGVSADYDEDGYSDGPNQHVHVEEAARSAINSPQNNYLEAKAHQDTVNQDSFQQGSDLEQEILQDNFTDFQESLHQSDVHHGNYQQVDFNEDRPHAFKKDFQQVSSNREQLMMAVQLGAPMKWYPQGMDQGEYDILTTRQVASFSPKAQSEPTMKTEFPGESTYIREMEGSQEMKESKEAESQESQEPIEVQQQPTVVSSSMGQKSSL